MTVIPERCAWCRKYDTPCTDATHGNPIARYIPIIERMETLTVMQLSAIPVVPGDAGEPRTVAAAGVTYRASTYTPVRTINPLAIAAVVAGVVFGLILVAYAITRPGPSPVTPACANSIPSCVHTIPLPPKDGPHEAALARLESGVRDEGEAQPARHDEDPPLVGRGLRQDFPHRWQPGAEGQERSAVREVNGMRIVDWG